MKKLNKKGFTLVELLAVIVILALLMVVATSSIGSILSNSKKSAMNTELKKLVGNVNTYVQQKSLNITDLKVIPGAVYDTDTTGAGSGIVCGTDGNYTYAISYTGGQVSGKVYIKDNEGNGSKASVSNGNTIDYTTSGLFEYKELGASATITANASGCAVTDANFVTS